MNYMEEIDTICIVTRAKQALRLNSQLEQAHPKESKKMTDNTQPDYPTWFKNPLNTKIRIGEHGHLLSGESYWQATALSKDHVLVKDALLHEPRVISDKR
jgi:hypothetical protein